MEGELVFDNSRSDHPSGPPSDLASDLASSAGLRNVADARLVDLSIRALGEDGWQGLGVRSPVHWLMWRAGLARTTARRMITLAARADQLPVTLSLLRQGRLSLDQAHAVARFTPGEYEESVCDMAQFATVPQIINATRRYDFDVEKPRPPHPGDADRSVSFGHDDDGTWWARIRLAADEGAVVEAALAKARDELQRAARESSNAAELGVPRTTWADAILGMANSALSTGARGATVRARSAVHIHLETPVATAEGPAADFDWVAELHGGARLPRWLSRKLACDCDVNLIWKRHGTPLATSANHRNPPDRLRRLVEHRDRYRCRAPGCNESRWLDLHHIVHWQDGGSTISSNLVLLCGRHHRMHHRGELGIVGDADVQDGPDVARRRGLQFTNQYGLRIDHVGQPRPPGPDDFPVVAPYACPTGERLQQRWVHFNRDRGPAGTRSATAVTIVRGGP